MFGRLLPILPKLRDSLQAEMSTHSPLKSLWTLQEACQAIDQSVKGILLSPTSEPAYQPQPEDLIW